MALSVTVLGCSGTYASPGGACSGYLVRSDTTSLWLDCGPGTLANVQDHVDLRDLDAVVVSHSHPDHWLELPVLRNALKYALGVDGLRVLGTAETKGFLDVICSDGVAPTFAWETMSDGMRASIGDLELQFSRTDHPVETLGVRISGGGRTLGYTADTGPDWSLSELDTDGHGFDLALCEATLGASEEGTAPHSSARQTGSMATSSGVRHLVLTHLMAGTADSRRHEAAAAFDGRVSIATIHERYEV
ncbi:MAG: MBL fold metallo-hydrolase [Actinomycetota bacterium]|nr:MBL fold metallo-hydrolase [Actinomycetota bacterium]